MTTDLFELYEDCLVEFSPSALRSAFLQALHKSDYMPRIAELRRYAGVDQKAEAKEAFRWCLKYIKNHGSTGRPKGGRATEVMKDGRFVGFTQEPDTPAPEISPFLASVLEMVGMLDARSGLECLSGHPSLRKWDPDEHGRMEPSWVAEKLEERFITAYERARTLDEIQDGDGLRGLRAQPGDSVQALRKASGNRRPASSDPGGPLPA